MTLEGTILTLICSKTAILEENETLSPPIFQKNGTIWVGESAKYLIYKLYVYNVITDQDIGSYFEEYIWTNTLGGRDYLVTTKNPGFQKPYDICDIRRCINTVNKLGVTYQQLITCELAQERYWNTIIKYWREIVYLNEIYGKFRGDDNNLQLLNIIVNAIQGCEMCRTILSIPSINITYLDWCNIINQDVIFYNIGIEDITFKSGSLYELINKFLKDKIQYNPCGTGVIICEM